MHATTSKGKLWGARIAMGIAVAFLIFDFVIKLAMIPAVSDSMNQLGWPVALARPIGVLELILLIVYLVPRTSIFGAILWTGYLGGAVATHWRLQNPLFSHILFPTYVGLLLWLGLWLRDHKLQGLIPVRGDG